MKHLPVCTLCFVALMFALAPSALAAQAIPVHSNPTATMIDRPVPWPLSGTTFDTPVPWPPSGLTLEGPVPWPRVAFDTPVPWPKRATPSVQSTRG